MFFPKVTILIPVYNSEKTIGYCLESVMNQLYPKEKIEVFLINNGKRDGSYNIFIDFQKKYPMVKLWWYDSKQGKSKALNKGIFSSQGKYIVNIDSDGWLDDKAIYNIVKKFENYPKINAQTGVVLIDHKLGVKSSKVVNFVRHCEFFEYVETFLIGRNAQSLTNSLYTMAGAFSCFRKEAILKTHMYNYETVGEDTHMTYQIRKFAGGRITLCEDAFFFVDPIESLDKLYIQRQRWQRGQLEVAKLFMDMHISRLSQFFSNFSLRVLINDHTLVFPRLIWFFGMFYLFFLGYPIKLIVGANILLYLGYVFNSLINLFVALLYLRERKEVQKYLLKNCYICLIMPCYRFFVYWMRVAGVINSLTTEAKWNTKTFREEVSLVKTTLKTSTNRRIPWLSKIKGWLNDE